jgi:hypothetical protein
MLTETHCVEPDKSPRKCTRRMPGLEGTLPTSERGRSTYGGLGLPRNNQRVVSSSPWRPTLYRPEFCRKMIEFCAQGYSITAFAGEIGVSRDCLTKWGQRYLLFLESIGAAKAAAARYHDEISLKIATNGGAPGQASMVMFYLRNLAPVEFRESCDVAAKVNALVVSASITPSMTPEPAVEAFLTAINGVAVEPPGEDV